ncbi:MAG: hypothetical protein ABSA76_00960 [Bacteroidales bacterium]
MIYLIIAGVVILIIVLSNKGTTVSAVSKPAAASAVSVALSTSGQPITSALEKPLYNFGTTETPLFTPSETAAMEAIQNSGVDFIAPAVNVSVTETPMPPAAKVPEAVTAPAVSQPEAAAPVSTYQLHGKAGIVLTEV